MVDRLLEAIYLYDSMKFKSLLDGIRYLKSKYMKDIKDSRKCYAIMEKYVKDYVDKKSDDFVESSVDKRNI